MILPVGASSFKDAMKMGVEVYHHLKVLKQTYVSFCYCVWYVEIIIHFLGAFVSKILSGFCHDS